MTDIAPRILILDDDPAYGEAMSAYLESQGCRVAAILDPAVLEATLSEGQYDLLLLDQRLGTTTGTDVLLRVREHTDLPCIIVTGLSDAVDRIVNLEIGADDEVQKTVPPREMLARIRSVLRRYRGQAARPAEQAASISGRWQILPARRELRRPDDSLCPLTTAEFDVLRILHDAKGEAVSRADLARRVFGRAFDPADRSVDTVVRKLRCKIDHVEQPRVIKTVRPLGYMFAGFLDEVEA